MSELKCPNCGSTNIKKTVQGHVKEGVTAFGAGVVLGVVKETVNSFTYGVCGRLIPTSLAEQAVQFVPVDHECQNCDCLFTVKCTSEGIIKDVSTTKLPMPDNIIQYVKTQYLNSLRINRPYTLSMIFGALTVFCWIGTLACSFIDSFLASGFCILFYSLFSIVFLILTVMKVSTIIKNNREINLSETQSLIEFKRTHRELFRDYSLYN